MKTITMKTIERGDDRCVARIGRCSGVSYHCVNNISDTSDNFEIFLIWIFLIWNCRIT